MHRFTLPLFASIAFLAPIAGHAADKAAAPKDARSLEYELAFRGHPDLEYRMYGVERYRKGQYDQAMTLLRRAAHYGDKPSQGLIAEMYAQGQGVERDMALAYAWMDLAAERGYKDFVVRRERYWARMSEAERERALKEGAGVYAEYGDDVAKPRFARQLLTESRKGVGSRTGYVGTVRVTVPSAFGDQSFDGEQLRSFSYWDPEKYWKLQDAMWKNPGGKVEAGDLEDVRATQAAPSATKTAEPVAPESEPR